MEQDGISSFHQRLKHLREHDARRAIVIALSGGVDSMCLAELLRQHGTDFQLVIAHFEHGLRGAESFADAQFVRDYAKEHSLPCYVQRGYLSSTDGGNLHATARERRYRFFRQVGADFFHGHPFWIATAHTADDQLEHFMIRWLQGRSPALLGANRQPEVIHLLAESTKAQLYHFAHNQGLAWREDSSNQSNYALRNRIRNHLLPCLEAEYAWSAARGRHVAAEFGKLVDSYHHLVEREFRILVDSAGTLDTTRLTTLDPYLQRQIIIRFLSPYSASMAEGMIDQALHCIRQNGTSTVTISKTHLLHHCYGRLTVRVCQPSASTPIDPVTIHGCGTFPFGDTSLSLALADENRSSVTAACIRLSDGDFPLTLRTRREGDFLRRAAGRITLKKFFINQKVPRDSRAYLLLLVDTHGVIRWIEGLGDVSFATTPTQKEYRIDLIQHHSAD